MKKSVRNIPLWKQHVFSICISVLCMAAAIAASSIYHNLVPDNTANVSLFFILALVLIGRYTVGYLYGIFFSLLSVVIINYIFTYPYLALNFTLAGYQITFIVMLGISLITSTMTAHISMQAEQIADREKQLAEAEMEKMRANLLRAISHDLRTPLAGIIGNSSLFLETQDKLTPNGQRELLTNIYEDSNWLLHMVENLLTVTRIEGDNFNISTCMEPVEEVIAEALQKFQKRYPLAKVTVQIPDDFILIPMDAILIEQVTTNLLENAVIHGQGEEPIEILVTDYPDNVSFTVRDHGVGIPATLIDHLFDGTASLAPKISDTRKGMGIGLSLCKTIITAHRGTLVGHNHQSGAEFIFTLPKNL